MSDAKKGIQYSEETKKIMSDVHKGKTHSEETKKKSHFLCPPSVYLPRVSLCRNYSVVVTAPQPQSFTTSGAKNDQLHPLFVTGFSDAEGCFHISVSHRAVSKFNWRVKAVFQIGVHLEELPLLLSIQEYFGGVGRITKDIKNNEVRYAVDKPEDIIKYIIPHFKSYPLLTNKCSDFILWSKVIDIMVN